MTFLGWNALGWGDFFLYAATLVTFVGAGSYWHTAPTWWRHRVGWSVMGALLCLGLVLILNTSYNLFGDWWLSVRPWARLVVYPVTAVVMGVWVYWIWETRWNLSLLFHRNPEKGTVR